MRKSLVNIFVYGDETHVHAIGWRVYEKAESYEELTNFLQSRVQHDHRSAHREDLAKPILWRDFEAMDRLNPFSGALAARGIVDENSIYCSTHIMNGEVQVDETRDVSSSGAVPDYLQVYSSESSFDFPQLIQDDYFDAIHLTNLDSHKVRSGRTHRLLPRFTYIDREGIENWLRSYNRDRDEFAEFIERYDTIASEARFAVRDSSPTPG